MKFRTVKWGCGFFFFFSFRYRSFPNVTSCNLQYADVLSALLNPQTLLVLTFTHVYSSFSSCVRILFFLLFITQMSALIDSWELAMCKHFTNLFASHHSWHEPSQTPPPPPVLCTIPFLLFPSVFFFSVWRKRSVSSRRQFDKRSPSYMKTG